MPILLIVDDEERNDLNDHVLINLEINRVCTVSESRCGEAQGSNIDLDEFDEGGDVSLCGHSNFNLACLIYLLQDSIEEEFKSLGNDALVTDDEFASERGVCWRAFLRNELLDDPVTHLSVV